MTHDTASALSATALPGLAQVRARIAAAEAAAARPHGAATLVAVSKTYGAEVMEQALAQGQRVFGENRVQEAQGKWPALKAAHPDIVLHLIGPLQTNKAADAVALFDVIETLDRPKLAQALARAMDQAGRRPPVLVQVNTGLEEQKAGCAPAETAGLVEQARALGLTVQGLMCIPPADQDPAPHFALLRTLAEQLGLTTLSMGMSGDFETAIAEGATHVRVGSAIFGHRT
ncbi:YggS family pyridoxal phosphate-dependent enzyme [Zavarzinia sp. CC-PAN008]|uniref:YggS family pyridoxal phosphate-dependent enzyme n=1 Tax=Zavarzinia sp. CC-PAN008 TaxID=3243332 RepID=UPI003F747C4F